MKKLKKIVLIIVVLATSSCQNIDTKKVQLISVNRSFEVVNQTVNKANQRYYNILEKCDGENKAFQKYKVAAKKLKIESNKLFDFIQAIKIEMITGADISIDSYKAYRKIINYHNTEVVNKFMIKKDNGKQIKLKIQNYRKLSMESTTGCFQEFDNSIVNTRRMEIDEHYLYDFGNLGTDDPTHWEKEVYKNITLIEAVLILTKIQADIRQPEAKILPLLASRVYYS